MDWNTAIWLACMWLRCDNTKPTLTSDTCSINSYIIIHWHLQKVLNKAWIVIVKGHSNVFPLLSDPVHVPNAGSSPLSPLLDVTEASYVNTTSKLRTECVFSAILFVVTRGHLSHMTMTYKQHFMCNVVQHSTHCLSGGEKVLIPLSPHWGCMVALQGHSCMDD